VNSPAALQERSGKKMLLGKNPVRQRKPKFWKKSTKNLKGAQARAICHQVFYAIQACMGK
jgi:hypothetical protein